MDERITRGYRAVEILYHAYLTGLILATVSRRGGAAAAELVFRTFRRQHLEKFLPGLEKLGLAHLPHAVACAQYHYLSNQLGGVRVEYMYESDTKAWVRYVPPRWIYEGAAICGVPSEVSRAMLRGWHAHNGVSLGNPRLGFVCTKQTTDGQPGLEGYYLEHDRDLEPEERLRFAPGEDGPTSIRRGRRGWKARTGRPSVCGRSCATTPWTMCGPSCPCLRRPSGRRRRATWAASPAPSSACSTTPRRRSSSVSRAPLPTTSRTISRVSATRRTTAWSARGRATRWWCASTLGG